MLKEMIFVGLGGFCGASARYGLGQLFPPPTCGFPRTTLLINVLGALLLACFGVWAERVPQLNRHLLLFLQVGLCGGFTTFSTFAVETVNLLQRGAVWMALAYVLLSTLLCFMAVGGVYYFLR